MGSRYHVVMVAYPAQSHIAPLMQLAGLLHARGAHVTFVHTQQNYRRLVDAKGEAAARPSSPTFRVEVIDDGLSASVQQHDVAGVVHALRRNCRGPFRALLGRLPPVTCVVADTVMTFAAMEAREAGVPDVGFFTASACGLMGYSQYGELIKRGLVPLPPLQDQAAADAMATPLHWVPGMSHMRLKDMPSFCHTTDPDDAMVAATLEQMQTALGSKAIVLNTLYELEKDVVDGLAAFFPPLYTVGPLAEAAAAAGAGGVGGMDISIWQEDAQCLAWLDKKKASSVVYVNFGSMHVMPAAQLREFALGLASCGFPFLWVKRPDVVDGEEEPEVEELLAAVARGEGLVVPWCAQPAVLKHPAVGLFLTHCGWNSVLEAVAAGQPLLCWPLYAEQSTNCRQVCECWGNGAELPKEVEHGAVSALLREMMEGELGREKRAKAAGWKAAAEAATREGGSSCRSLDRLVEHVLLPLHTE